jgi:hypothetical protein
MENFEISGSIRHKGYGGHTLRGDWNKTCFITCADNELTVRWGVLNKQIIKIAPQQIYNYEVDEGIKVPSLQFEPKKIKIEYKGKNGEETWFEFTSHSSPFVSKLFEYLKEKVKQPKQV